MSFSTTDTNKGLRWLLVAIGFVLIISVATSSYAKSVTNREQPIDDSVTIDKIFVDKSNRLLKLMNKGQVIKSYHVALGDSPAGHKQRQGDERTPTGNYILDYKNEKSKFYRSIHVSYPNAADKARAKKLGVNAGGDIMIHGQTNGLGHLAAITQQRDWTDGCIAVTNDEMDEIMAIYKVGMPIEIVE